MGNLLLIQLWTRSAEYYFFSILSIICSLSFVKLLNDELFLLSDVPTAGLQSWSINLALV